MGNGEWGMGNREWGMGNGEWGIGNGEWGMGNGEWGIGKRIVSFIQLGARSAPQEHAVPLLLITHYSLLITHYFKTIINRLNEADPKELRVI
ncbi:MAG: hypothetical protein F6K47_42115 [Symploca sp. SIO2E6]|nr:hypothetical protein [Symploca sp. SIO2E6]